MGLYDCPPLRDKLVGRTRMRDSVFSSCLWPSALFRDEHFWSLCFWTPPGFISDHLDRKREGNPRFCLSIKLLASPLVYYMLCGLWLMPNAFSSTWEALPSEIYQPFTICLETFFGQPADQTHTPGIIPLAPKNPESSVSCTFFVLMGGGSSKKEKMIV